MSYLILFILLWAWMFSVPEIKDTGNQIWVLCFLVQGCYSSIYIYITFLIFKSSHDDEVCVNLVGWFHLTCFGLCTYWLLNPPLSFTLTSWILPPMGASARIDSRQLCDVSLCWLGHDAHRLLTSEGLSIGETQVWRDTGCVICQSFARLSWFPSSPEQVWTYAFLGDMETAWEGFRRRYVPRIVWF